MEERQPLTVKALTKYIKLKFDYDKNLQGLLLKGELSNVKRHSRGHIYFTLKMMRHKLMRLCLQVPPHI